MRPHEALKKALAAHPDSATLLTENAEVLYRAGKPWEVGPAVAAALKADPCFARAFFVYGSLMGLQSNQATERKAIQTAHQLDPNDVEIRNAWLNLLPSQERIPALEALVGSGANNDDEEVKRRQKDLDDLKKTAAEPAKTCRLVSNATTAEVPLQAIIQERHGILANVGHTLNVSLNGHESHLMLDTGADGLTVSRGVAEKAGLKPSGATANADQIKIGPLEFKDCRISVVEKGMGEQDGLIGTDVFSRFLITLDYPVSKLKLDALPNPTTQSQPEPLSLSTEGSDAAGEGRAADRSIAPEMKDWLPVFRVGHDLILPGSLHPPDVKLFLVDTGADSTNIAPEAAREVTKVYFNNSLRAYLPEGAKPYVAEAVDIKFGGISKHEMGLPAWPMDMERTEAGMEIAGKLGADILEELTIHIDYRDGLMKFEYDPKRGYHPPNR